jgi:hypothetical protein
MPRDGAMLLSDLPEPVLELICRKCGRAGRFSVARLIVRGRVRQASLRPGLNPGTRTAGVFILRLRGRVDRNRIEILF